MNTKIIAGLSTVAAALAVASPALAQDAPDPGQTPIISPAQPVAPGGSSTISPAQPVAPGGGTIVPPAQPNAPTNVQPGISVHINDCVARTSAHGYAYAVCPIVAENVPYYRTIHLSFRSSMKTFKPRTAGSWSAQTGTLKLSSGGSLAGDTTTVTGNLKFAFPKAGVATVDRDLKVTIAPRSSSVFVSQGTAVVATS